MPRKGGKHDEDYENKSDDSDFDYENCSKKVKKPKVKVRKAKTNKIEANEKVLTLNQVQNKPLTSNFIKYYRNNEMGLPCFMYRPSLKKSIINYCKTFQVYRAETYFNRRVTYLTWHHSNPKLLAVASHGGDIVLYNYEQDSKSSLYIEGIGAGGSIQDMKFDPHDPNQIYTASMEGKFLVLNFLTKKQKPFLKTNDINRWFISLDINCSSNIMVAGDTRGGLSVLTLDGKTIGTFQLHKKGTKISHAEFSKREPWLLCTSSTDSSIKFWDIRKIKAESNDMSQPIQVIQHTAPVNAAYFSLTDGCRLMTTDQNDKILIYRAPLWTLETTIFHPHRQFQHLTPIRAYWHPMDDIVFAGRYPSPNFPGYHDGELRTIDFFDAETGELLHQHYQRGINGIMALTRFNISGDAFASCFGCRFLIWRPDFKYLENHSQRQNGFNEKSVCLDLNANESENENESNNNNKVDWDAVLKSQTKEKRKRNNETKKPKDKKAKKQ